MTSWNCSRSIVSVCSRCSDSSICLVGGRFGPAVDLGHQEHFLAVAVPQGLAHADLALAVVVVPAVVHEVDAVVDGGADDPDALVSSSCMPMCDPPSPTSDTFSRGTAEGTGTASRTPGCVHVFGNPDKTVSATAARSSSRRVIAAPSIWSMLLFRMGRLKKTKV